MGKKRVLISALLLVFIGAVFALPGIQLAGTPTERLANGSFEEGFVSTAAGFVGSGWQWFDAGGRVEYGFYDDTWSPVVSEGQHSQLIQIDSTGLEETDGDRYAGIYQTVAVVPGEVYEVSLHGMLRALEGDPDLCCFNYRAEYGIDYDGGDDWVAVDTWVEIPWDTVYPRLAPGSMDAFTTTIQAAGSRLTLFIRARKKWATVDRQFDLNLDAVSLKGAMPPDRENPSARLTAPAYPVAGWRYAIPVEAENDVGITKLEFYDGSNLVDSLTSEVGLVSVSHRFYWRPATSGSHTLKVVVYDVAGDRATAKGSVVVGREGQFLVNGDFEGGFDPVAKGMVGRGWRWFDSGGKASYGFYDETWTPVVYDGRHSQLLEINTKGQAASDPDRYSGIYQTVDGLTPGATYQLSLYGMLRAMSQDGDDAATDYRAQWGYDPEGGTDWTAVETWVDIPWDVVYPRLDPGEMSGYMTSFEAPAKSITLFLRAWKKWETPGRELNVNLDAITLKGFK
jgi:hypothetical protein